MLVKDSLTHFILHRALTQQVYDLAERVGYAWERASARYRNLETGRYVSEARLIGLIDGYNSTAVRANIDRLTDRLLSGKLDLAGWQTKMATELKDGYIVNLQIGRGGKEATTFSDYGRLGNRLRQEYKHLNQFAQEIKLGTLSDAQIKARAAQYANGPRTAYWDGKRAANKEAGFTEERRVLNPAEHCEDCIGYAAQDWQPLGSLPEPGENSVCRHNCKCSKEYR